MTDLIAGLTDSIGAREVETDIVTEASVARIAATLGVENPAPAAGDPLPPGWHCAYFTPATPPDALAADGLPVETGLLPPVPLPRRMFGGARLDFTRPIRVGDALTRTTELAALEQKETRSGPLVRAVLRQTLATDAGTAMTEEQDILHLAAPPPDAPPPPPRPAPEDPVWRHTVDPDPVLLFRYSAITFNAHRIHYDAPYARDVEGYPGLLVQGKLLALLVLELCRARNPAPVRAFSYRAVRPVYDGAAFLVAGRPEADGAELWIADGDGALAVTATAHFATA